MTCFIYSTDNANGESGAKRCIFNELLKDFTNTYDFEYLVRFFEEKAQEYFCIAVAEDEKYFANKENYAIDFSKEDNYLTVLKVVRVVKTLQYFYNRGYNFKLLAISTEHNGWIMKFKFDFSNLSKERIEIIRSYVFERC